MSNELVTTLSCALGALLGPRPALTCREGQIVVVVVVGVVGVVVGW
jgi:hypothetical protein